MYYTYMLRCADGSLYTGMTNDLDKRLSEHISGAGAKYTKSHQVEKLEIAWSSKSKSTYIRNIIMFEHITDLEDFIVKQIRKKYTKMSECRYII